MSQIAENGGKNTANNNNEGESRLQEFAQLAESVRLANSSGKIWQSSSNGYEPEGREFESPGRTTL
jgi:hypothetical protein